MLTDNILELIGNTPLLQLKGENIFAKAEFLNPGGSIKDRVALAMLKAAQRDGKLKQDSIIDEPTSGNTGIGMSMVANRYRNVRAALCHNLYTVRLSRKHNDANILVLGGRVLGVGLALEMVDLFLSTDFEGGRHQRRVEEIESKGK